jgi:hypothetical protein
MNLTFVNGTDEQKGVVRNAYNSLLHLNLDRFSFDLEVEFIPNPDPTVHNEFATTYAGDTVQIKIRQDFPAFAPTWKWGDVGFASETAVHELGHALWSIIPTVVQDSLLTLFGYTRDEYEGQELEGNAIPWGDRIKEGMAETFKDAFLPLRKRAFANRTNVRLPIPQYPVFRYIWRQAMAGTYDLFETHGHEMSWYVPPADIIDFAGTDGLHRYVTDVTPDGFYPAPWEDAFYAGVVGQGTNGPDGFYDDVVIDVEPGQVYSYEFTIPADWETRLGAGGVLWGFEKRFLGDLDPAVRQFSYFQMATSFDVGFWTVVAEHDSYPDPRPNHTNSVVDPLIGTHDPVLDLDREYGAPASGYFWFWDGSWPLTVREEFIVPVGATQMVVNAQMTIQVKRDAIRPIVNPDPDVPEIDIFLPEMLVGSVGVPADDPIPAAVMENQSQRGGGRLTGRSVSGSRI